MPAVCTHPSTSNLPDLTGSLAIVIDLLRASTTITYALAAGAAAIAPCESIEAARERATRFPPGTCLLGGERRGVRIEGFDLGNSPTEYTPTVVHGKTIIFTTTNGTVAIHRAEPARRILIGCFANLSAVTAAARDSGLPINIICAGIHGQASREDTICAGALAAHLSTLGLDVTGPDALHAIDIYKSIPKTFDGLAAALLKTEGGQNLLAEHLEFDVPTCAAIDSQRTVPEWIAADRLIR
jgi:2-phosphosulfolactate phosphatase